MLTFARIPGHLEEQIVALEALKNSKSYYNGNGNISRIANNIMYGARDLTSEFRSRLNNLCATPNYSKGGKNANRKPTYDFKRGSARH